MFSFWQKKSPEFYLVFFPGAHNSRDAIQAILPSSDVQRRVSVDVDNLQIAVGIQQQLSNLHAAGECRPVKANVFLLQKMNKNQQYAVNCKSEINPTASISKSGEFLNK